MPVVRAKKKLTLTVWYIFTKSGLSLNIHKTKIVQFHNS